MTVNLLPQFEQERARSLNGFFPMTDQTQCFDWLAVDEELHRNPLRKTGALLSKGAFKGLKQRINPEHLGGAPLLGLKKLVVKAHGSSNRHQIAGAIGITLDVVRKDMIARILQDAREASELLQPIDLAVGTNA